MSLKEAVEVRRLKLYRITGDIAGWDTQSSTESNCKVRIVSAHAGTLKMGVRTVAQLVQTSMIARGYPSESAAPAPNKAGE